MASGFVERIVPSFGSGFFDIAIALLLGGLVLAICGGFVWYVLKKKIKWNLKVEFRLPREIQPVYDEEGNIIDIRGSIKKEWGKGYYDSKKGVVFLKRPKKQPVAMKPFNIKESLSASNILTVIQIGAEDYRPVIEGSYLNIEEMNGEPAALVRAKVDTSEAKQWKNSYERERKATYSFSDLMAKYGQYLGWGFILFIQFVGFAIVIQRIQG